MRTKTLIVLAVVAVLAVAGALLLQKRSAPDSSVADGVLLYPDLRPGLNDVARIDVTAPGADAPLLLERRENGWVVVPKSGYPADAGKIRQLLLRLSDARIVEVKTSNPELYSRLDLADTGDGGGTLLVIGAPADVSLLVGSRGAAGGSGTYVRRQGEAQSYLVDVDLDVGGAPADWLDRDLFDVDAGAVNRVVITHPDGETLELIRVGELLVAAGIPSGRELSNIGAAQPIARGLAGLRLDDVVPVSEFDGAEPEATVEYHLDDGRRITAQAWRKGDGRWLAFNVGMDPPPAESVPAQPEAGPPAQDDGAQTARGEAGAPAAGAAGAESGEQGGTRQRADPESVAKEDAALSGWVFEVPVHRYEQMVRRMEDLLKPKAQ